MAADNHTTIVGNLVEDPEVRFTNNGIAVTNLRVAVTQRSSRTASGATATSGRSPNSRPTRSGLPQVGHGQGRTLQSARQRRAELRPPTAGRARR
jgi:hypothetical protein